MSLAFFSLSIMAKFQSPFFSECITCGKGKQKKKIEAAAQQLGPIKLIFWYYGPTHTRKHPHTPTHTQTHTTT